MKSCTCAYCNKIFQARVTRFRDNNRFKPKYCSSICYGQARTLPETERKAKKKARNKNYYIRRKAAGNKPLLNKKNNFVSCFKKYEESYE